MEISRNTLSQARHLIKKRGRKWFKLNHKEVYNSLAERDKRVKI